MQRIQKTRRPMRHGGSLGWWPKIASVCLAVSIAAGCSSVPAAATDDLVGVVLLSGQSEAEVRSLSGSTLSGDVELDVRDEPRYEAVAFHLDDERRDSAPSFVDDEPPYRLVLDTKAMEDGPHTLTVVVALTRGRPVVAHHPFVVANRTTSEPSDGSGSDEEPASDGDSGGGGEPAEVEEPTEEVSPTTDPNQFEDDFSGYLPGAWPQYGTIGSWTVHWTGGGQVAVVEEGATRVLELASSANPVPDEWGDTASTLVTSTHATHGDIELTATMRTLNQLRDDGNRGEPNAWEVGWLAWNQSVVDGKQRFYYLTLKPNGWELGKVDQTSFGDTGGQRFLATGSSPSFAVGTTWRDVRVRQDGARIRVWVDGSLLTEFVDGPGSAGWPAWNPAEEVFTSGKIGLYHEDAQVQFGPVAVRSTNALDLVQAASQP